MLETCDAQRNFLIAWESISDAPELPESGTDFFEKTGPVRSSYGDRRQFPRFYLREKAILKNDDCLHAVYSKDFSRMGICFLCSQQLFPLEKLALYLANGDRHDVKIVRCRRIQKSCYECGAKFVFPPEK